LEDWADSLGDELSGGVDAFFCVLDEDWDFASAWRFKDSGDLLDGLLENLWWTDIDFGDDDHDWDVECQCNPQVLFAHSDQPVIRSYH
jgi:hypothetical protein